MARKLFLLYLAIVFGPWLLFALAFALRDWIVRRRAERYPRGDGHAEGERLTETVEEVRAP